MPTISGGKVIEGAQLRPVVQTNPSTGASITPVAIYSNAGAPTVDVTLLGVAAVGALLVDTTNGILYICTATNGTSTIVWTKVGTQT